MGGLAGAVGTYKAVDFALRDREADLGERLNAAEVFRDARRREERAHCRRSASSRLRTAEGHNPPGLNAMTSTSAKPKISMRITSGSISIRPKRSEEHTSELQSPDHLVCRLLLEKK